jgi:hypothetical protein
VVKAEKVTLDNKALERLFQAKVPNLSELPFVTQAWALLCAAVGGFNKDLCNNTNIKKQTFTWTT